MAKLAPFQGDNLAAKSATFLAVARRASSTTRFDNGVREDLNLRSESAWKPLARLGILNQDEVGATPGQSREGIAGIEHP
jgi:hypothetical protein